MYLHLALMSRWFSGGARMRRRTGGHDYVHPPNLTKTRFGSWFWFAPSAFRAVTPKPACPPNGPRVYEPARRAQAVAILSFSNRRDRRAGCRRPADDQREEASVNPLLCAVAISVLPPALPGMAGPRKAFVFASYRNPRQMNHLAGISTWQDS